MFVVNDLKRGGGHRLSGAGKAKRKNRFVSGALGEEKKLNRVGAKIFFLIKKMMFDAY